MHRDRLVPCVVPTLGAILGIAAGVATITLATAEAQQSPTGPQTVLDATHLPPLLTAGDEPVELAYDVSCAAGRTDDIETGCDISGTVFVRAVGGRTFEPITLSRRSVDGGARQLVAQVPETLSERPSGIEYYAVLEASDLGETVTVPAGGAEAPHVSRPLGRSVDLSLGRHTFGRELRAGREVAFAGWGDGVAQVGLEPGRNVGPIGASAFDVDASGTVAVLDQAHRRLLRWRKGARSPDSVSLSVTGTLADIALADDGSVYVLESSAEPGRNPFVRRFDDGGRELEEVETAERTASQIRMAPDGPLVLGNPSHQWFPVSVDGVPASRPQQLRRGRPSRPLRGGGEIVVYRFANELRLALLAGGSVTRSWRIVSGTPLAEVQLAEPMGQRVVVVVRVYEEDVDEFAVLILDRKGLVDRFAIDPEDWAETAPLGRFRLVGRSLYQLGSSPAGAFVNRFDLEVR